MAVKVETINDTTFQVTVAADVVTTHTVTVSREYWMRLTNGRIPVETLVGKSFEFLLEREHNTSILRSFDLPVIQRYFSEYEETIAQPRA